MTDGPHTSAHMSPAQAAQVAGVSRWSIMRAINAHDLQAHRDNRNHWRIAPDDLDRWRASTVRTVEVAHPLHTPELAEIERLKDENSQLRERLAAAEAERRLRETAEADRDRWQAMAEKLADRPSWWARLWGRR